MVVVKRWGESGARSGWGRSGTYRLARQINKLSARTAETINWLGRHSDGGGLYLVVGPSLAWRCLFMYRRGEKWHEMGFGGAMVVSLKEACIMADETRSQRRQGLDPLDEQKRAVAVKQVEVRPNTNFGNMTVETINRLKKGFKNEKYIAQWDLILQDYTKPLWTYVRCQHHD